MSSSTPRIWGSSPLPVDNFDTASYLASIPEYTLPTYEQTKKPSVCDSRKSRKEVMFATGKAGKRGQRKPRFTSDSSIHCKD